MRKKLLLSGMGCLLCFGTYTLANVVLLPFARQCYGYPLLPTALALIAALCLFLFVFGKIRDADEGKLKRALRAAEPCLIAVLFAVQLFFGWLMRYTPLGDNLMLYNGSMMLASDGCFDANPDFGLYLARFSNQWGFLLILTGLRRLFLLFGIADFFMPLVALQALLYSLGVHALGRIARMLGGIHAQARLLLLLTLCLPLYLAAGVLYTDTYSAPFVVFTLLFALKTLRAETFRHRLGFAALTGLLALIGGQIKMTVFIVLIAAMIVWALSMRPAHAILCAGLSIALALGGTAAVHSFMLDHVIDPAVYAQENTPAIHWFMMSIPTSDNPYGGATGDYGITWGMMDKGASHEEVMSSIYTRIRDRIYTLRYPNRLLLAMCRKNACAMGDGTFGMTEMLDDKPVRHSILSEIVLEGGRYYPLYSAISSGIFFADLALALAACLRDIRKKYISAALPAIAMFGMLLFMMLWEARGRYVFCFVPVLLLLASRFAPEKRV